jgi:ubiquinone/menaquinone biosynthesis C-methylase UbiE
MSDRMEPTLETEIKNVIATWCESVLANDVATAAALRETSYLAVRPDGEVLTRQQELTFMSSAGYPVTDMQIHDIWIKGTGRSATAVFDCMMEYQVSGGVTADLYRFTMSFRKSGDQWRALKSRIERRSSLGHKDLKDPFRRRYGTVRAAARINIAARRELRRVRNTVRNWARRQFAPSFPELAYLPYKAGSDYSLPASQPVQAPSAAHAELPVPPREMWLGYQYLVDGKRDVDTMLKIVGASDFAFKPGDRILDLGCAAGRMIRQLQPLADTCEIWGTDINAEHIFWCKRNLSPPFHFATTTKVPHLPFEDRSFHLIYCGSVFTHIDDLADAWLLELRRLLAPDGRLYLTISDEHTLALFDTDRYKSVRYPAWIKRQKVYQDTKDSFDMFTVARDNESQVYYNREYFLRNARSMAFEILSVTEEAYSFQTAVLMKRK